MKQIPDIETRNLWRKQAMEDTNLEDIPTNFLVILDALEECLLEIKLLNNALTNNGNDGF